MTEAGKFRIGYRYENRDPTTVESVRDVVIEKEKEIHYT